jgi:AbrB family looped-hinge helix DNA binding protein
MSRTRLTNSPVIQPTSSYLPYCSNAYRLKKGSRLEFVKILTKWYLYIVGKVLQIGVFSMDAVLVESAKILPKGQVTLPKDIRQSLGLNEGDRVTLIQQGEQVIMMNSTVYAMRILQEAMRGEAKIAGIFSEDDAIKLIANLRRESQS